MPLNRKNSRAIVRRTRKPEAPEHIEQATANPGELRETPGKCCGSSRCSECGRCMHCGDGDDQ